MKIKLTTPNPVYKPLHYPWALELWKKHEQMHWLSDEVPLAEDVKDWNSKLSKEEINLLTQIFRFFTQQDVVVGGAYVDQYLKVFKANDVRMMLTGFAARECFDENTEILTDTGWIKFPDLNPQTLVAQYNVDTKAINFVVPTEHISKSFTGKLHYYSNKTTNILVTPGHRLIVTHPTSRKTELRTSESGLWGKNYLYPSAGYATGEDTEVSTMERLLIAIQADGRVRSHCPSHPDTKKTVDISVKKQRKIERITKYLTELGLNCAPRIKGGMVKFTFTLPEEIDHLKIKTMEFIDLKKLSSQKAYDLIEEIIFWDGSTYEYPNGDVTNAYYNTNERAIDIVQSVASLAGVSSIKGINRKAGELQVLENKYPSKTKTCYVLSFSSQVERTYPHREELEYNGKVYCVTVPSGAIITRRNGKVAASGNCIHQEAYAILLDTVGMPEVEYSAFLEYKEMKEKFEYAQKFNVDTPYETAKCLAVFSAFMEGLQLFSSFAMLMNFPRFNKMKGMGQIVTWSVRDENCFSEDTQILTPEGWKLFSELKETDLVAQYNKNGTITFVKPTKYIMRDVDEELIHFHSEKSPVDQLVTKGHRIVYNKDTTKGQELLVCEADDFKPHTRNWFINSGKLKSGNKTLSDFERFLIAFQADGSFQSGNYRNGNLCGHITVTFNLTKARKRLALEGLLEKLGFKYGVIITDEVTEETTYRVQVPTSYVLHKEFKDWVPVLSELNDSYCKDFVEELVKWDGHIITDDRYYYSSVVKTNVEIAQTIACLAGYYTNVGVQVDERKPQYKDVNRLYITKSKSQHRTGSVVKSPVPYTGKVYCVSVPSTMIVIKRNDAISISGNCHVEGMMMLFRTFIHENKSIWNDKLKKELYDIARQMVEHEDAFIDLAFAQGGIEGMTPEDIKLYIRYICDRRLIQLGLKPNYGVKDNPIPWLDEVLNAPEFVNFFEQRATEYSRGASTGTWDDAFSEPEPEPEPDKYLVYGQIGCGQCVTAKHLLNSAGKEFEYVDLTCNTAKKLELYEKYNAKSMPIIFKNGEFFGSVFDLQKDLVTTDSA